MKRNIFIVGSIVLLGLLLVGAAFVGGQLFRMQQQQQANSDNLGTPQMQVTPAAEVPKGDPTVDGYMDHRDGNSIFLCSFAPLSQVPRSMRMELSIKVVHAAVA